MRKYVVWFHNKTDCRDDEWAAVFANNSEQARQKALPKMEQHRFTMGKVYTIGEFREEFGDDWPV